MRFVFFWPNDILLANGMQLRMWHCGVTGSCLLQIEHSVVRIQHAEAKQSVHLDHQAHTIISGTARSDLRSLANVQVAHDRDTARRSLVSQDH